MKNVTHTTKDWYHVDAKEQILGRMATDIATHLRGKHKPTFIPHKDEGDIVLVTNCAHVVLSGNKDLTKKYERFSGYPGGIRTKTARKLREDEPTAIVYNAVFHMLPKNKLRTTMMKRLKLFPEAEHPYEQHLKNKA